MGFKNVNGSPTFGLDSLHKPLLNCYNYFFWSWTDGGDTLKPSPLRGRVFTRLSRIKPVPKTIRHRFAHICILVKDIDAAIEHCARI